MLVPEGKFRKRCVSSSSQKVVSVSPGLGAACSVGLRAVTAARSRGVGRGRAVPSVRQMQLRTLA